MEETEELFDYIVGDMVKTKEGWVASNGCIDKYGRW